MIIGFGLFVQVFLGLHCCLATACGGADGLTVIWIGYIAGGKYAWYIGERTCTLSLDIAVFIGLYPGLEHI